VTVRAIWHLEIEKLKIAEAGSIFDARCPIIRFQDFI